jgi:hypothetical protein
MSDLPYIKQAQEVKITGQDSTGLTVNFVGADINGNLLTKAQIQDNNGAAITLGQKVIASSLPVVLSSDQTGINTFLDKNGTGTISIINGVVTAITNGASTVVFTVSGTWNATIFFKGVKPDGSMEYLYANEIAFGTDIFAQNYSVNATYVVNCAGYTTVTVKAEIFSSGTIVVGWNSSSGVAQTKIFQPTAASLQTTSFINDGFGNKITSSSNNNTTNQQLIHHQTPDTIINSTPLGALNSTISIVTAGINSVSFQIATGTLIGTIIPEVSIDGGINWFQSLFINLTSGLITSNIIFSSNNTLIATGILLCPGTSNVRVRVSSYTSGTANSIMRATITNNAITVFSSPLDGQKPTYSSAVLGLIPGMLATDIFTIIGSATKTIRVLKIRVTETETTTNTFNIILLKRSTANSGGTSSALVRIAHDSNNPISSASVLTYTVNPLTLGTLVGNIRTSKMFGPATGTNGQEIIWQFGDLPGQTLVLRGITESFSINLNGVVQTGQNFNIDIEWTEE